MEELIQPWNMHEPYMSKDHVTIDAEKWNYAISEQIMEELICDKFTPQSKLADDLLATGSKYLAEAGRGNICTCGISMTHTHAKSS